jgi:hypothetical protein
MEVMIIEKKLITKRQRGLLQKEKREKHNNRNIMEEVTPFVTRLSCCLVVN